MNLASETWPALCAIAVALGLRHAFDADHLTAIDGMVRRNAVSRPAVARVAGLLFSLGHIAVFVAATFATSMMASRWHAPPWLEPAGMLVSAAILMSLGTLNLYAVWIAAPSAVVSPMGLRSRLFDRAFASRNPLMPLGIGAVFAISADTLSQAAALGLAALQFGGLWRAIIVASWFGAGMALASGVNGYWMAHLVRITSRRGAVASRVMTCAIGLMSMAVAVLMIAEFLVPQLAIFSTGQSLREGAAIIATAVVAFVVAMMVGRGPKKRLSSTACDLGRLPKRVRGSF